VGDAVLDAADDEPVQVLTGPAEHPLPPGRTSRRDREGASSGRELRGGIVVSPQILNGRHS
jgi:hypothetical protein